MKDKKDKATRTANLKRKREKLAKMCKYQLTLWQNSNGDLAPIIHQLKRNKAAYSIKERILDNKVYYAVFTEGTFIQAPSKQ